MEISMGELLSFHLNLNQMYIMENKLSSKTTPPVLPSPLIWVD